MRVMEFAARCAWVFLCLVGTMLVVVLGMGGSPFLVLLGFGFFFVGRYAWRLRRQLKSPSRRHS